MAAACCLNAPAAGALTADEVLVVANARSEESLALGRFYLQQRAIPQENLVRVETAAGFSISRGEYETQILQPLRKAMADRGIGKRIRCVVVVYGVPVQIAGAVDASRAAELAACRACATDVRSRLAVLQQLLETVGRKFPPPGDAGPLAVEDPQALETLFGGELPAPPKNPPDSTTTIQKLTAALTEKDRSVAGLTEMAKRRIAQRQLLALRREMDGLEGLAAYLKTNAVAGAPPTADVEKRLGELQRQLAETDTQPATRESPQTQLRLMRRTIGLGRTDQYVQRMIHEIAPPESDAALDSELALLWWPKYPLARFLWNPTYWRFPPDRAAGAPPVLMTARIDGPSKDDALRIVLASAAAEKTGLTGTFYIDAGGGARVRASVYETHLEQLAAMVRRHTALKCVLDTQPAVFAPGACPDAALYVGWYSLRQYVPAFMWRPGAVAWHIASFEAEDLRNPQSTRWCVKMIQSGVAATVGAVNEPTLGAFPLPEEFFPLLLTGKYTVAECYWRTNPMVNWRMTLIADPLYNPFAANPQMPPDALPAGLAP